MLEYILTHIAAATDLAVAHSVLPFDPISQYNFDRVSLYGYKGDINFVFRVMNRL